MMQKTKKLLITFLGTSHRRTTYLMNGREQTTEYILEALASFTSPDEIIVYGTRGSGWLDLYEYIINRLSDAERRNADADRILKALTEADSAAKNAPNNQLEALSEEISACVQPLAGMGVLSGVTRISIRLLRYGPEKDVNDGNYRLLADDLRQRLSGDGRYDVAFDITHSFRSFPFFNYAVLEYLRCVLPSEISISHIYYGDYENHDKDGRTNIIDLGFVTRVHALTRAVEEFRHTGRTATLAGLLTEEADHGMKDALLTFEKGMDTNALDKIRSGISRLLNETANPDDTSPVGDARSLIREALRENLLDEHCSDADLSKAWKGIEKTGVARQQLMITNMLCRTGNYGQASLVVTEAMITIIHQILSGSGQFSAAELTGKSETELINSTINHIRHSSSKARADVFLRQLAELYGSVKQFRNVYAHNLDTTEDERRQLSYGEAQKKIGELRGKLDKFILCISPKAGDDPMYSEARETIVQTALRQLQQRS